MFLQELTKGKYVTLHNTDEMAYYVDLNGSIGFKFVVTGQTKIGSVGVDVDKVAVKALLQEYFKPENTKIEIQIIGGDNSKIAIEYFQNLNTLFQELQHSSDWSGELKCTHSVNLEIHPNYISLLGTELEHGLNPLD